MVAVVSHCSTLIPMISALEPAPTPPPPSLSDWRWKQTDNIKKKKEGMKDTHSLPGSSQWGHSWPLAWWSGSCLPETPSASATHTVVCMLQSESMFIYKSQKNVQLCPFRSLIPEMLLRSGCYWPWSKTAPSPADWLVAWPGWACSNMIR